MKHSKNIWNFVAICLLLIGISSSVYSAASSWTELHRICADGDETLLEEYSKSINPETVDVPVSGIASKEGSEQEVYNGCTALQIACYKPKPLRMCAILLGKGASPFVTNRITDLSAIHIAALKGDFDLFKFLVKLSVDNYDVKMKTDHSLKTVLHYAAEISQAEFINQVLKDPYLQDKLDLKAADSEGRTFLHVACIRGLDTVVKQVVKEVVRLMTFRDDRGSTPLLLAVYNKHFSTVRAIVDGLAQSELLDSTTLAKFYRSAYARACDFQARNQDSEIMKLLGDQVLEFELQKS